MKNIYTYCHSITHLALYNSTSYILLKEINFFNVEQQSAKFRELEVMQDRECKGKGVGRDDKWKEEGDFGMETWAMDLKVMLNII